MSTVMMSWAYSNMDSKDLDLYGLLPRGIDLLNLLPKQVDLYSIVQRATLRIQGPLSTFATAILVGCTLETYSYFNHSRR